MGTMAFQGSIRRWVSDHRRHHAHADQEGDVHSPRADPWGQDIAGWRGFVHSHIGWMFDNTATDMSVYGKGLMKDPVISFFTRTHALWLAVSLALPYGFGYLLGGPQAALVRCCLGVSCGQPFSTTSFGAWLRSDIALAAATSNRTTAVPTSTSSPCSPWVTAGTTTTIAFLARIGMASTPVRSISMRGSSSSCIAADGRKISSTPRRSNERESGHPNKSLDRPFANCEVGARGRPG